MKLNEFHALDSGLGPLYLLDVGEIQHFKEVWSRDLGDEEARRFYAVCWMAEHFWTLSKKVEGLEDANLQDDLDEAQATISELRDEIIELNQLVLSLR